MALWSVLLISLLAASQVQAVFISCLTGSAPLTICKIHPYDVDSDSKVVRISSEDPSRICKQGVHYDLAYYDWLFLGVTGGCGGTFLITSSQVPSWESWGDWGSCSVSCGANGTQTRSRLCDTGTPTDCEGQATDTRDCHGGQCPQVTTTGEDLSICGKSASSLGYRIIGGTEADKCEFPWMAMVYSRDRRTLCGGTIIDKTHILTAAHCLMSKDGVIDSPGSLRIYTGATEVPLKRASYLIDGIKIRRASNIKMHEEYDDNLLNNDIAIVTLSKPIAYDNCHIPICLPGREDKALDATGCKTMGWGTTENFNSRSTSSKLLEVDIKVHNPEKCEGRRMYGRYFTRSIKICAGGGGVGSCGGDSGGPLICKGEEGRYVQYAIVSGGALNMCGDVPGIYTRVSHYEEWIAKNTK